MKNLLLILSILLFSTCQFQRTIEPTISNDTLLETIAFGSCNKENSPQPLWQYIIENEPDLWVWTGDNVYGDTEDMQVLKQKYDLQKNNPEYQKLLNTCPVVGIWDDHDYGVNDGDKHYPKKDESKNLMFDFLEVATDNEARTRSGTYQAYSFGETNKMVKVILLDARYFRDELRKEGTPYHYVPNDTGDVLGEAQWTWLENELSDKSINLTVIACGIQFLAKDHRFEKWANFPNARQRLFDLLEEKQPNATILLSGDRHIAEISKIKLDNLPYDLYDITSSGLTHSYEAVGNELNQLRVDNKLSGQKNFGLLKINWNTSPLKIKVEIRGLNNQLIFDQDIEF
jgi:alkaline phosphatase D